jgi:hypothetical protein
MIRVLRVASVVIALALTQACAGTEGRPESVRALLAKKYVGKEVDVAVLDFGAPNSIAILDSGRKVYTWRRQTDKYKNNLFIKSDERCVITLVTGTNGTLIEAVGQVDDSLGAWQISYCSEQFSL